jgi:hypothetical protein
MNPSMRCRRRHFDTAPILAFGTRLERGCRQGVLWRHPFPRRHPPFASLAISMRLHLLVVVASGLAGSRNGWRRS